MHLLNITSHRPWPLPSNHWMMRQKWRDLLFIHWPIPAETLQKHIPRSLKIDTFNGTAWLGIVAFVITGVYLRGLSPVSILPPFPEINVRTYVQYNGKPGVYFMSLDVANWASYIIAKRWLHLPYHAADISILKRGNSYHFDSNRKQKRDIPIKCKGIFTPLSEIYLPKAKTLDHWLTERYCFFSTNKRGNIYCGEIHHRPWLLQQTKSEIAENTLFSPFHINFANTQPIAHYSKGVDALIWNIKRY